MVVNGLLLFLPPREELGDYVRKILVVLYRHSQASPPLAMLLTGLFSAISGSVALSKINRELGDYFTIEK